MKNIIKLAMSAMLAVGCAYIAKSQACPGYNNSISHKETSSALGADNKVYGKASTAIGQLNTVSVSTSTNPAYAIGYNNQATAKRTFALGDSNKVTKAYSFAIGSTNTVNANTSVAIGCWLKNTVDYGITIGMGNQMSAPLLNNTGGIMMGMNSDKPTLFISRAGGADKTGKVGIGNVTEPQAKLHIKSDSDESAEILLEPTVSDSIAAIYFKNRNNYIKMRTAADMDFKAVRYNFQDGKISLGYINGNIPKANIHIFGMKGENANIQLQPTDNAKDAEILFRNTNNKISVGPDNAMSFAAGSYIFNNGNVSIGTTRNDGYKLAVKGIIRTEEVVVEMMKDWPDYVFNDDYQLTSLEDVKKFIDDNGHLPGMPSAEQVSNDGVKLGEINTKLLEKVEELTIYIIQQEERIKALENKLDSKTQN